MVLLTVMMGIMLFSMTTYATAGTATKDSIKIRELLEDRDQEIKDLLGPKGSDYTEQQRDRLKDIINSIVDYRSMAKKALQSTFDTLSTE
jgi:phospholipid transport system substrate-binding protein